MWLQTGMVADLKNGQVLEFQNGEVVQLQGGKFMQLQTEMWQGCRPRLWTSREVMWCKFILGMGVMRLQAQTANILDLA